MVKQPWPLTTVVEVLWTDACSMTRWDSVENYLEHDILPVASTGYLLKRTKQAITLLQSQSKDRGADSAICIPMKWVKKVTVLRK